MINSVYSVKAFEKILDSDRNLLLIYKASLMIMKNIAVKIDRSSILTLTECTRYVSRMWFWEFVWKPRISS